MKKGEKYSEGDIFIVAQTSRCLQFHTARIQKISGNNVSVVYLSTNKKDIIPLGYQVRLLKHVGRGIEIKRVRPSKASEPKKGFIDKNGLEQGNSSANLSEDAHTSYVNNFNV